MKKLTLVLAFPLLLSGTSYFAGCKKSEKKVVARVGNVKITTEDLLKELSNLPGTYQNYLSTLEGKKQFLDIILREKILLRAAEKSRIFRKKEVQKNLVEYQKRAKEQEIEFRKGLILREYLRELQDGDLKVTEPELKLYYDQSGTDFKNPVKVTASHILSSTQEGAEKAYQRVRKGEDFAKVARELSTDPSSSRGGIIGEVSRGDLADLPEFEEQLFALKKGQVSNIVRTKIGYHIIKKNSETELPSQTFEKAAPQIRRILEKRKFDEWIEKIKKEENSWVDETVLAATPLIPTHSQSSIR